MPRGGCSNTILVFTYYSKSPLYLDCAVYGTYHSICISL